MLTSKSANHTSRILLLASDCKNTVIAEMAGSIHHLAYSPYGQQSSRQEVMTQLGFNGELREAKIDWYVLGNGYRVYSPRLMRFHSPDTFSPFGKGGLNTYMYCGGDPVMNVDPTGHSLSSILKSIWDKSWKVAAFFDPTNNSSGSRNNALPTVTPSGEGGLWKAAGALDAASQLPHKPRALGGGSQSAKKRMRPSFKSSQQPLHAATPNADTAPSTQMKAKPTSTSYSSSSSASSRRDSSASFLSNSSSASTPSTVSTVSSISRYSNDSGYTSSNTGSTRSNDSANDRLQARLDNLRKN